MKITKFPQSCILVEISGKKILIDPGSIDYKDEYLEHWKGVDAVLVTHKHSDHCHADAVQAIIDGSDAKLYTTAEVSEAFPEIELEIVKSGDKIELDDVTVEVTDAVHGYMPFLTGDRAITENVGYIIDDGATRTYHTSDTISFKNSHKCDLLFVPVCNHGLVMGAFEAAHFAKETGAKLVVPMHYDNPKFPADMEKVREKFDKCELNYKIMQNNDSVDVRAGLLI